LHVIVIPVQKKKRRKKKKENEVMDVSKNPDYQKGLELVSKSDCFTCHKIDEPLTGPAYRDVANKYANEPDTIVTHLAHKIIEGGRWCVWTGAYDATPFYFRRRCEGNGEIRFIA
jgi:cytochrome c